MAFCSCATIAGMVNCPMHSPACSCASTGGRYNCPLHGLSTTAAARPQPAPLMNERQCIQDLVKADLEARKAFGLKKYGTLLQAHNGRDALMDLYQELLDACMYVRQAIEERT